MGEYLVDFRDIQFILYEWLGAEKLCEFEAYKDFNKEVFDMVIDQALKFYLDQMRALLENGALEPDQRMMEATHYGMRRLRERDKGQGYAWPFVLTAVLVRGEDGWRFHTLHWSMPVD